MRRRSTARAKSAWSAGSTASIRSAVTFHIAQIVRSYRDLQPELLGRVEELIDFVTMS